MKVINQLKKIGHFCFAVWGTLRYFLWYRKITIIGVTGTDGKSSTVFLTAEILRKAGKKTAHYSSISKHDGLTERVNHSKMTTPGRAALHHFLYSARQHGAEYAVIEITSEGILEWRHLGILFDVIVYTNITPEHIERHGSFEAYTNTKLSLLRSLKSDGYVLWNVSDHTLAQNKVVFERYTNNHEVHIAEDSASEDPFYHRNLQMAAAIADIYKVPKELVKEFHVHPVKIPGRFEIFKGKSVKCIVDYAHTIHALEMCLQAVRKMTKNRIIHVFGAAGGGRDTYKRPLLAKISEKYADISILTEENSFDENTFEIIQGIQSGFSPDAAVYIELEREQAIKKAFALAREGDIVLCTAKGSEVAIAGPNRNMRPYSERSYIATCINSN